MIVSSKHVTLIAGGVLFCLLAILNTGGYRYGIGDQAFYVPAVVQHLDPSLFPRDRMLLHVQDQFLLFDDGAAAIVKAFGVPLPALSFAAFLLSLALLFGGAAAIGRTLYRSWWTVAMLTALLTLRHRITQTGANTLEGYFHPRMMAFALGVWAIASYLRGRGMLAVALVAAACALHPTTAVWFGIWIATALAVTERSWRLPLVVLAGFGAIAALWMVSLGPLRGRLVSMDPVWASVLASKDYIFPSDWTPVFWLVNLGYVAVIIAIYEIRRRRAVARPRELGLVAGALALACVFLISWPLMRSGIALALQLQISRVFWMLDFLAAVYLAWLFVEQSPARLRRAVVVAAVAIATARGLYVTFWEHRGAPIVALNPPDNNWTDVMNWISSTPADSHVLADPGHAWKYGASVRVAGERDVYLEDVKDVSLSLYSREVAMRVLGRIQDAHDFGALTPERAQALAKQYDLTYLVVDRDMNLPLAYRNTQFRVYTLTPAISK